MQQLEDTADIFKHFELLVLKTCIDYVLNSL